MKLNKEQVAALRPYEEYFNTAINADYARYPGIPALSVMFGVLASVSTGAIKPNYNCQACVLRLLKDVGRMYYESKEALTKVESSDVSADPVEKVVVKTRKRRTTK